MVGFGVGLFERERENVFGGVVGIAVGREHLAEHRLEIVADILHAVDRRQGAHGVEVVFLGEHILNGLAELGADLFAPRKFGRRVVARVERQNVEEVDVVV